MKKLFYSLMLAAAALVVGCNDPEGPNNGGGTDNNEFYGLAMEQGDVTVIGPDEYIIQMYNIATVEERQVMSSIVSAHVTIPGVEKQGDQYIIPEGTYDILGGEKGTTPYYYKGSFYMDMYSSTPFNALLTGKLEVKHTTKGHRITIYSNGVNVETAATIKNLDFRYDGKLAFEGNVTPMISVGSQDPEDTEPDPYAFYRGVYDKEDGSILWEMQILAAGNQSAVYYYKIMVVTTSEGDLESDLESGIPTGTYPIALTGEPGTVIATYFTQDGDLDGSMFLVESKEGVGLYDAFFGGELDIVNNGDGTYEIVFDYYNYYGIPMTASYEGVMTTVDYADIVNVYYGGDNNWNLYCWDMNTGNGICTVLDVYSAEDTTFAGGLTAGTYNVAETKEAMTIVPGKVQSGMMYGSAFWNLGFNGYYDTVSSGTMEVTRDGENYTIALDLVGAEGVVESYEWECDRAVLEDMSEGSEANAVAPLKVAEKQTPAKFSTYKSSGKMHKSDVLVKSNRAF